MSPDTPLDRWGSQMPRGLRERRAVSPSRPRAAKAIEGQGEGVVTGGAIKAPGGDEPVPRGEILLSPAPGAGTPHPRNHIRVTGVPQSRGDPDGDGGRHEDEVEAPT